MYQKSLDINVKVHGHEHPIVTTTLHNIGLVHREQTRYDLEAECFEKCGAICAQVYVWC